MAVPLGAASAVIAGSFAYVIGGSINLNGTQGSRSVYFAKLDGKGIPGLWTATSSLPSPVMQTGAATVDQTVYVMGGAIPSSGKNEIVATVSLAKIESNGALSAWTEGPPLPEPMAGAAAVVLNGYAYLIGGYNKAGGATTSLGTVYVSPIGHDGRLGPWTTTTPLPSGRYFHSATASKAGYIYVVGGFYGEPGITTSIFKTGKMECEPRRILVGRQQPDGSIRDWTPGAPFAEEAVTPIVAVMDSTLVVIGGYSHRTTEGSVNVLAAPLGATGSIGHWNVVAQLPETAISRAGAASDTAVYTFGGSETAGDKVRLTAAVNVVPIRDGKASCAGP
jgi:hypothetical protein